MNVIEAEEALSIVLRKLYRLAYESIENDEEEKSFQDKYIHIAKQYINIIDESSVSKPPKSPKELIVILEKLISSSNDGLIYGKKDDFNQIKDDKDDPNDPKVLLLKYCQNDNIDQAILLLLQYKWSDSNKSCLALCEYQKTSSGWAYHTETAVHLIMVNISKSNKYKRRLLLFEIFLREQLSTSSVMYASGGYHTEIRDDSIFQMALSIDNMDVYDLIFKYSADVNIDDKCTTNNSTNKSSSYSIWKPIHKSVENKNYPLTELLIKHGANIKDYKTDFYLDDYNISKRDRQETLLYLACTKIKDENKMLKLILNTYKSDINGLPDVNKFNMYIVTEMKPKDIYEKELKAVKQRIKEAKRQNNPNYVDDDDDYGEWNNRRSPYFLRRSKHVYHYETLMHYAVKQCNQELVKMLLIYGADIDLYRIKTLQRNVFHQQYGAHGRKEYTEKERADLMKAFHDRFIESYKKRKKLELYESVEDVYQLLEQTKCDDDKTKENIKKMLQSGTRWFPDMMQFYPNNMGKALYIIDNIWCKQIPKEIVCIIINFFYTIH